MADDVKRGEYLAGETTGEDLTADERETLDRIGRHLGDADLWEPPAFDGQFRLLAAAAAEAANTAEAPSDGETQPPLPATAEPAQAPGQGQTSDPIATPDRTVTPDPGQTPDSMGSQERTPPPDRSEESDRAATPAKTGGQIAGPDRETDATVIDLNKRRTGRQRAIGFGAGLALAGAAALALVTTGQLTLDQDDEDEPVVTATYDLAATPLDPDAVASLDVAPTASGVEFRLSLMGLDNPEGDGYYAAWLMGPDEAIPLGTFHWRKGGVTIVLWSGIDDPAYDQFVVTRQTMGDGGLRSDEVVLTGDVPDLTAPDS